jgi:hypothetical protein
MGVGGKPQRGPKPTFDIPMAKYKQGKADIRGHENRTIWNTEPNWNTEPVSLSQVGTSTVGS